MELTANGARAGTPSGTAPNTSARRLASTSALAFPPERQQPRPGYPTETTSTPTYPRGHQVLIPPA